MATLSEMLRGYADKIANLPTEATRFLAGPTSFLDATTGKMNMPEERGFAEGFFGLQKPENQSVLDPRNNQYTEGYDTGEPFGYAAIASPFVAAGANKLSNKAVQAITKNPFATDIGVIDYASTFSPVKMAQELKKNDLNFFSTLDETVNNLPQAKGTGQQYMAQILKSPAVKQEEVMYRGLDKFLEQNPKVTKTEIQDFLHTSPVKLKETVLDDAYEGAQRTDLVDDYRLRDGDVIDDYDYIDSRTEDYLDDFKNDPDMRMQEREAILMNRGDEFADYDLNPSIAEKLEREVDDALYERAYAQSKEEYYSDPYMRYDDEYGGEITGNESVGYYIRNSEGRNITPDRGVYNLRDAEDILRDNHVEQGNLRYEPESGPKFADYQTEGPSKNYREVLIQLEDSVPQYSIAPHPTLEGKYTLKGPVRGDPYLTGADGNPIAFDSQEKAMASPIFQRYRNQVEPINYQEGHFDENNVLAHMRVNDRMIDGKKSLFVEEIQSDWHQQGRKRGYESENKVKRAEEIKKIQEERQFLLDEKKNLEQQAEPFTSQGKDAPPEIVDRWSAVSNRINDLQSAENKLNRATSQGVPDAPYKKSWQEMAMRRAIQMAVDEGYDRVAFTTGVQQVKRYEKQLRQAVDEINFNKRDENTVSISANKGGRETFSGIVKDGKFTEGPAEAIGKTVEEVLGKGIAKQIADQEIMKPKSIRDKDLTIGGEGMKGFYDKILPEYVNKYGKKYGIKVGKTNLNQEPSTFTFDDYKKYYNETDPSLDNSFVRFAWDNKDQDMMDKFLEGMSDKKGDEVHYFDITPEAKKSLLEKGSPLFAIPPAVEMTDEESRKEMLERLFKENQK
jgi:hypothetical protein